MSGSSSEMEWERPDEREPWDGVGSDVLFLATGLCLASLSVASWVLSLAGWGSNRVDRSADYPDFDL
jgi:hypothetical protein